MPETEPLPLGELRLHQALGFGGTVLAVEGSLVFGTTDEFRSALQRILGGGTPRLILDLRAATFIDSSGLGALVAARRLTAETKTELVLWGLRPQVRRVFAMVHALELFRIVDHDNPLAG